MITFLEDLFDGSAGPLGGRVPNTVIGTFAWIEDGPALSLDGSGSIVSDTTTNTASFGSSYSLLTGGSSSQLLDIEIEFTMGADISANANGHYGIRTWFNINGNNWRGLLFADPSDVWILQLLGPSVNQYFYMTGHLTGGSTYTMALHIEEGSQSLTVNGQTVTASGTLYGVDGLGSIQLNVGHPNSVSRLTVSDATPAGPDPETVNADLTAELGILDTTSAQATHLVGLPGTFFASAHSSAGEREFSGIAQIGTLNARTGASASLGAQPGTLVSSITVPISVQANLSGQAGTMEASATVAVTMRADLRLSSSGTLEAYAGAVAALSAQPGDLSAAAVAGVLAQFAGGAPMGTLQAAASAGIVVNAHLVGQLTMPAPSMYADLAAPMGILFASSHVVMEIAFESYVMNLKPTNKARVHEVTHYTQMPFSGMVRWQGNWYGWGPSGLYLIGGDTDEGEPIPWAWNTGITNFGSRQMKVVRETFLHGRLGPTATASVSIGEDADVTYAAVIERGRNAQAHRIKYGKGLKAEYWSFGLADVTGSAMEVDSMQHEPQPLSRKI